MARSANFMPVNLSFEERGALLRLLAPFAAESKTDFVRAGNIRGFHNTVKVMLGAVKEPQPVFAKFAEKILSIIPQSFDDFDKNARVLRIKRAAEEVFRFANLCGLSGDPSCAAQISASIRPSAPLPVFDQNPALSSDWREIKSRDKLDAGAKAAGGEPRVQTKAATPSQSGQERGKQTSDSNPAREYRALTPDEILCGDVKFVKGVGERVARSLNSKGIFTVKDLLYFLPRKYDDRRLVTRIAELKIGEEAVCEGRIIDMDKSGGRYGRRPFNALVTDGTAQIMLSWFHYGSEYVAKKFKIGDVVRFSGKVGMFNRMRQILHPNVEHADADAEDMTSPILPRYSEVSGVHAKTLRKIILGAVDKYAPLLHSPIPKEIFPKMLEINLWDAVRALHMPKEGMDAAALTARQTLEHKRIAFEEIFLLQLALTWLKTRRRRTAGLRFEDRRGLLETARKSLPFELTGAQEKALNDICSDLLAPSPMSRLMQGDVGCGKTVVALLSALIPIANEAQAAIMAPTEILAAQHYETALKLFAPLGVKVGLLVGGQSAREAGRVKAMTASGEIDLLIGTHALIYAGVLFKRLGYVVIDEQHRFGVEQRSALKGKGVEPDMLVMTATPIPRTLALTLYGDLDVSVVDEMPKGRLPVKTSVFTEAERNKAYHIIRRHIDSGDKAYIVYPRVEEGESDDMRSAVEMFDYLAEHHLKGVRMGLVHGRMPADEKQRAISDFKEGRISVLVSTTVIEVGVDAPDATVMVVEHADRFGLSQLHQLRGRVGRGLTQSYCYLIAGAEYSENAFNRLSVMAETNDGFRIAEEDLKQRGPGEYLGSRQAGMPDDLLLLMVKHPELIEESRKAAAALLAADANLSTPSNEELKLKLMNEWGRKLRFADA